MPRPRLHLIRFHGVLAPNAKLRVQVVPQEPEPLPQAAASAECEAACPKEISTGFIAELNRDYIASGAVSAIRG